MFPAHADAFSVELQYFFLALGTEYTSKMGVIIWCEKRWNSEELKQNSKQSGLHDTFM